MPSLRAASGRACWLLCTAAWSWRWRAAAAGWGPRCWGEAPAPAGAARAAWRANGCRGVPLARGGGCRHMHLRAGLVGAPHTQLEARCGACSPSGPQARRAVPLPQAAQGAVAPRRAACDGACRWAAGEWEPPPPLPCCRCHAAAAACRPWGLLLVSHAAAASSPALPASCLVTPGQTWAACLQ